MKDGVQWSLTSLREKLVKVGAKVVRHARYAIFQMAEVAVPKELFEQILRLIATNTSQCAIGRVVNSASTEARLTCFSSTEILPSTNS